MAIVEDRVVCSIRLLDLVQRLRDQEALEAIARHEGERALEEIEPSERGKLVEHQEKPMTAGFRLEILGQAAADLVEDQADQRLSAVDVGRRHDEVERRRVPSTHDVANPPIAAARHLGDNGIAIEAEERHGGRQHARALVVRLVEQFARRRCDHRMRPGFAEMRRCHHRRECGFDRSLRI